ncbi:MAG: GNAT family N-acetyltransferase [Desulfobacter sp.]|nr:GNAT family N-acetyltransferase [Desulfobacter sp.]WDP86119.1 MAG: GNAT family N-acetyltransferase [Desulfobacter sp.]
MKEQGDIKDEINIELVKAAPIKDMIRLYKAAGWWEDSFDEAHDFLKALPKDSALFAGAFCQGRLIGMGRALSDLCSDAYIQDIVVLKSYRGHGIGTMIVDALVAELKQRGVDWIGLIAEPGTNNFYEKMGFVQIKDHVPFKLGS